MESMCDGNRISNVGGVCDLGRRFSIIEASDYSLTVRTAAHELGHGLGAVHDGEGVASACKPSDLFLMAPEMYLPNRRSRYTRNPWLFSYCSLASFKTILIAKDCVKVKGIVYNEQEWMNYTMNQPGEVYSLNEQCSIINGPKSRFWGVSTV
ncbi:hypothetical protein CHS0354_025306 [Potamilus streckersoni]|uniref:Peptidase M12B domain-containing protein n=1 Tax=Potamilus streckersoni TaxID=2493646 RepID=A0AAE0RVD1_9BIVA|nr:hypothetical protein CHS0354_025306 [Potamilus streckersoni]